MNREDWRKKSIEEAKAVAPIDDNNLTSIGRGQSHVFLQIPSKKKQFNKKILR